MSEAISNPARTDWRAVWVVVAAGVVSAFHLGKAAIAAPQLQADLGLSLGMLGALGATFAVLGALGGVVAGSVVARAGDHRMLVLGLLATALGAAMAVPTDRFGVLLASRVVEGLGFLLITVAGPTVLARRARAKDQATALVLWSCFMPAGMALAMLTGPWFGGWRGLWGPPRWQPVCSWSWWWGGCRVVHGLPARATRPAWPRSGAPNPWRWPPRSCSTA